MPTRNDSRSIGAVVFVMFRFFWSLFLFPVHFLKIFLELEVGSCWQLKVVGSWQLLVVDAFVIVPSYNYYYCSRVLVLILRQPGIYIALSNPKLMGDKIR
jgi:hypothetical protein